MPTIKMSASKAAQFFDKISTDTFRYWMHRLAELILEREMYVSIITKDYTKVYKIPTKAIMKNLIRTGSAPPKASYNPTYVKRKLNRQFYPFTSDQPTHVLTGNFQDNITFEASVKNVTIKLSSAAGVKSYGTGKSFNYFLKHEMEKSVLKSTFVMAWQGIMDILKDYLLETAQNI